MERPPTTIPLDRGSEASAAHGGSSSVAGRIGRWRIRELGAGALVGHWRVLAASAVLSLAIAAFVVADRRSTGGKTASCSGADTDIAQVWNSGMRDRVASHLQGLGSYARGEAARLDHELTAFADRWAGAHHEACLANSRGEFTVAMYERELACLERSRVGLESVVDALSNIPEDRLSDAIVAAHSLSEAAQCRDESFAGVPGPPRELADAASALAANLERARVRVRARDPEAPRVAAAMVTRSERLGYAPLTARAYLISGMAMLSVDDTAGAIPALSHAAHTALGAGDDAVFVEAYAREIFAIAVTEDAQRPAEAASALGALSFAEQIAVRLGPAAAFARPLLFNNAGVVLRSGGNNDGARRWFRKALEEPGIRERDLELASAYGNLGLLSDDPAQRDALFAEERAMLERAVGADHVMTLDARLKASIFHANPVDAAAELRELCDRYQRLHPTTARSQIDLCLYQVGWLAQMRGDVTEARVSFAAIPGTGGPQDLAARAHRSLLAGEPEEALRAAREAIAHLDANWWTRMYAVDAQITLAEAQLQLARSDDAIATLQHALVEAEGLASVEVGADRPRRLAQIRSRLAVVEQARDRTAALAHARQAAAWYRAAGGYGKEVSALEILLSGDAPGPGRASASPR